MVLLLRFNTNAPQVDSFTVGNVFKLRKTFVGAKKKKKNSVACAELTWALRL
jgi:hypothetical protein